MKIVIIGKNGYIGSYLYRYLSAFFEVEGYGRSDLDITKEQEVERFFSDHKYDIIILAAASKDIKTLEADEKFAYDINVKPVELFLKYAGDEKLLFFSSDYVFDGKSGNYGDDCPTCPVSVYGKTKVMAEELLKKSSKNYIILRTAAVLGKGSVFFDWLVESLRHGTKLEMFDNSFFSPTCISYLCEAVKKIIEQNCSKKILHLVQEKRLSRYELALFVQRYLNTKCEIVPSASSFKDLSLVRSDWLEGQGFDDFDTYLRKEIKNV